MNYDHSFHAGGFSDVLKHTVFAACIGALNIKETPYRIIDAFAGQGLYDFKSQAASRCPEWLEGVAKLDIPNDDEFFAPYITILHQLNPNMKTFASIRYYAGSPVLAKNLCRAIDRLTLLEANSKIALQLRSAIGKDKTVSILESDSWRALVGLLPPPEKRGIVLIDPPFETLNELERIFPLLENCLKKWRNGIFMVWVPLKTTVQENFVIQSLKQISNMMNYKVESLFLKLQVKEYGTEGLPANAVFLINPPHKVIQTAPAALEILEKIFCNSNLKNGTRVEIV